MLSKDIVLTKCSCVLCWELRNMRCIFTYSVNLFQVFNLQNSPSRGERFKTKTSRGIYSSCISCTSLLISGQVCESICEAMGNKIKYTECPRAKPVLQLTSVCCLQLQPLPEDSIRPTVLLTNCISLQVRSEECLTQHAIIHLSCSNLPCCSCPRIHPAPSLPPPPAVEAVHSASRAVGCTIDLAEMMVSKREA